MPETGVEDEDAAPAALPDNEAPAVDAPGTGVWARWKRGQEKIAVAGTAFFGNMWTFYGFLVLALCPLAPPLKAYLPEVAYTSGVVIQLIALPLLAVGARVIGRRSDKVAQEMHDNVMAQLKAAQDEHQLQKEEREAAQERTKQLRDILPTLPAELQEYARELMEDAGLDAAAPVLPDLPDPNVEADPGPTSAIGRFNDRVAVVGTKVFGSMGTFWGLFALSLLPVVPGLHFLQHPMTYAIQSVLQLVALPLLAVGNVVLGKHSEQMARETAQATMENVYAVREMHAAERAASMRLHHENAILADILEAVPKLVTRTVAVKSSLMEESRAMLDNDVPISKVLSHYRRVFANCVRGESLKNARIAAGLSVNEVAAKVGKPASQVTSAEDGEFATTHLGKQIALALGTDYDSLRETAAKKARFESGLARIALG